MMMNQPPVKYVHRYVTRHGKELCYFRRGNGPRIRLPLDRHSPAFAEAYAAAFNGAPIPHVRDMPVTSVNSRKQRAERAIKSLLRGAKARARSKGVEFDLTLDWALAELDRQGFCCALTGIEFFAAHTSAGTKNPYSPSLDRIRAGGPYTQDNVRIVAFAINSMLLDWGPDVFEQVANSYRYRKHKIRNSMCQPVAICANLEISKDYSIPYAV